MRRRFRVWLLLVCVVLGCALPTKEKYNAKLNTWIGADVADLIIAWGPPSDTTTLPTPDTTGVTKKYTWHVINYWPGYDGQEARYCDTTFSVNAMDKVVTWTWKGTNCTSK